MDSPSMSLLSKLGSIVVHAEEMIEPGGHAFDVETLRGLLTDPEVQAWRAEMDALALLPVKRAGGEKAEEAGEA